MEIQAQVGLLLWVIGISIGLMSLTLGLYGRWIWDLNRKISNVVTGHECEIRNDNHYGGVKELRLEVKADIKEIVEEFDKDLGLIGDRFSSALKQLSKERDISMSSLEKQLIIHNKVAFEQYQANIDQNQKNFDALVKVLEKIGCKN
jgi:hypothetical protein